jgi:hypothetical protein
MKQHLENNHFNQRGEPSISTMPFFEAALLEIKLIVGRPAELTCRTATFRVTRVV